MTRPCLVIPATGVLFLAAFTAQAGTVAHWRFETGPAITPVLHSTAAGVFDGTTPDASGNGNHLSVWSQGGGSGYAYRTDVPLTVVPGTGGSNRFSVKNTGGYPTMFTAATASSPTGINLDTLRPPQFTVEASYKPEASAGYRTVVGRDARTVAVDNGDLAAFYLQVRPDDSVGAAFVDVSGFTHRAYSPPGWLYGFNFGSNPEGTGAPWYNLAAVSDGATLKLYVDNVLVASTDLTLSGSPNTALARGSVSGGDWTTGAWSVGRGLYAGAHTDRAYGFIDEVRISDSALTPDLLLFAPRPYIAETHVSNGLVTLQVERGQPGVTCSVLHSYDPRLPVSRWAPIGTRAFDSNGAFSFTEPSASMSGRTTAPEPQRRMEVTPAGLTSAAMRPIRTTARHFTRFLTRWAWAPPRNGRA